MLRHYFQKDVRSHQKIYKSAHSPTGSSPSMVKRRKSHTSSSSLKDKRNKGGSRFFLLPFTFPQIVDIFWNYDDTSSPHFVSCKFFLRKHLPVYTKRYKVSSILLYVLVRSHVRRITRNVISKLQTVFVLTLRSILHLLLNNFFVDRSIISWVCY